MSLVHFVGHAVAVGVAQPVQGGAFGAVAHGEHARAEGQEALGVLDLVAVAGHAVVNAVAVGVGEQHQVAAFLRGDDVAAGVEGHGDERADFVVAHEALDGELAVDDEPGALAVGDHFVAPGQGVAEVAVAGGGDPVGVVELRGGPALELADAGLPGFVGGVGLERAALLLDEHAGGEAGGADVGVGHAHGDDVAAALEVLLDVDELHLPPVGAFGHGLAVDR